MGNGTNRDFSIPFPFVSRTHITATVAGVAAPFTWFNNTTIRMVTAPANSASVVISRDSTLGGFGVDFNDASVLGEVALDAANLQSFFTAEEARELAEPVIDAVATAQAAQTAAEAALTAANNALTAANNAVTQANAALAAGLASNATTRVLKTGDTMTGPLILPAPSLGTHATNRDYVDTADALRVLKAGDTMTGMLNLAAAAPTLAAHATRKDYVDNIVASRIGFLTGLWGSANYGPGVSDEFFFEIILPTGTRGVFGVMSARAQGTGGYATGIYSAVLANSSLAPVSTLAAEPLTVRAATVEVVNMGRSFAWSGAALAASHRIRFFVRNGDAAVSQHLVQSFTASL